MQNSHNDYVHIIKRKVNMVLNVHRNRPHDDDDDEVMLNVLRCQLTY